MTITKHYYKTLLFLSILCFTSFSYGQNKENETQQSNKELLAKAGGLTSTSYLNPFSKWSFYNKNIKNQIGLSILNMDANGDAIAFQTG